MAVRSRDELTARDGVDHARAARRGVGSLAYALLVLGIVVVTIGISARVSVRWDLSAQAVNVLGPMTVSAIGGLCDTVTLYPLFPDNHPAYEAYRDLLDLYRQRSSKVAEFIDPVAQPGRVRDLGVKFDQAGGNRSGLTVAVRGDRRLVFRGLRLQCGARHLPGHPHRSLGVRHRPGHAGSATVAGSPIAPVV